MSKTFGFPVFWGRDELPSGCVKIAIEAMAIEIVDLPIKMVIFHS